MNKICGVLLAVALAFVGCARWEKEVPVSVAKSAAGSRVVPPLVVLTQPAKVVASAPAPVAPLDVSPAVEATWSYRIVNATGLPDAVTFMVQGQTLQEGGYQSGEVTGTLLPPAAEFTIAALHPACSDAHKLVLKMQPAQQLAVVAYCQASSDGGDKPSLQFSVIEARSASRGRRGLVVSFCQPAEGAAGSGMDVYFGDTLVPLVHAEPKTVMLQLSKQGQGTALPIKFGEATVDSLDLERKGNTAVVFYNDQTTGEVRSVYWFNDRQE